MLDVRFQLCALSAAAVVLLPTGVLLPGFRSGLDFVAERMSLAGAVLFCALVASVRLPRPLVGAMAAVASCSSGYLTPMSAPSTRWKRRWSGWWRNCRRDSGW
jgi:hypothetical protein